MSEIPLTKSEKKKVRELLSNAENEGRDYYFNEYTSLEDFKKKYPFLPQSFFDSLEKYTQGYKEVNKFLDDLESQVGG